MAVKVTKRENFEAIKAILENMEKSDLVDFISHEIELLNRKNATDRKPTEKQIANEAIKSKITNYLLENAPTAYTATELQKMLEDAEITNQRVSALMRQLITEGKVIKTISKGKTLFSAVVDN